jgi:hypothetical protein
MPVCARFRIAGLKGGIAMSVRAAHPSESSAVFSVLTEIAPEIPLRLDNEERQRRIRELVDGACASQMSWVSLDEGDNVVGFLFGRTRSTDTRGMEFSGVELLYGGVLPAHRGCGRFSKLLTEAKKLRAPLWAVVKRANTSAMAERLLKYGFAKQADSLRPDEDTFVWKP